MRPVYLIFLTLLTFYRIEGQTIAELEAKLPSLTDTARVNALNKLAFHFARTDSTRSFTYSREAFLLAQKLKFHEGVATALNREGVAYYFANSSNKSIKRIEASIKYATDHQVWPLVSEGYENLAGMYFSISSNYSLSLDYYLKAYEVYEKYNPSGRKYVPLLGIASTYKEQAQYAKALEYINRALPLIEAAKDERNHAIALENAGGVYWLMRDLPKAKESFMLAKEKFEKIKSMGGLIFCYVGLANIAREEGDLATSLSLSETALALGDKFPQYDGAKLHGLRSMGKTLYALKKYEDAQVHFENGLRIAFKLDMTEFIRDLYQELAKVAAARKDYAKAYEYQSKFSTYADSVLNAEMSQQLSEVRTRFETEKQEAEIEILKRDNQISKFYFITAMASMLGIIAFGYLIITRQRLKNRKDRELAAIQNQALEARQALVEVELKNKELSEANLRDQLDFKNKELTTHTLNLIQKNEALENIKHLVEEMRLLPDAQVRPKLTSLINTVNYSFNLDRDWENFKMHFEKVHQGFFERLLKDFPDLNGNDLKLCALMKLNMETKEIATVIDISPESVKVARHRLRKKLNLATEQNLSSFLVSY